MQINKRHYFGAALVRSQMPNYNMTAAPTGIGWEKPNFHQYSLYNGRDSNRNPSDTKQFLTSASLHLQLSNSRSTNLDYFD